MSSCRFELHNGTARQKGLRPSFCSRPVPSFDFCWNLGRGRGIISGILEACELELGSPELFGPLLVQQAVCPLQARCSQDAVWGLGRFSACPEAQRQQLPVRPHPRFSGAVDRPGGSSARPGVQNFACLWGSESKGRGNAPHRILQLLLSQWDADVRDATISTMCLMDKITHNPLVGLLFHVFHEKVSAGHFGKHIVPFPPHPSWDTECSVLGPS